MTCERCGQECPPSTRAPRKYCSENCRKRACDDRNRAACIDCGAPLAARSAWRSGDHGYDRCPTCWGEFQAAQKRARLEFVAKLYNQGASIRDINTALGRGENSNPSKDIQEARDAGLITTYRYPQERRRNIREGHARAAA